MKRASVDVLHNQENLLVALKRLVELSEALVVDLLHNLDLSFHALPPVWLKELEFLIDLDCDLLV